MNLSEYIPFTAALINLVLTCFITSRGLRATGSKVYCIWGLSLLIWNFGTFMMFEVQTPDQALFWARFLQVGVIFLPVTLAHLCLLIGHIRVPRLFFLAYAIDFVLVAGNFGDFVVKSVHYVGYAYYSVAGPGFWVLVSTYALPSIVVVLLIRKRKTLSPMHARRLTNMVIAAVAMIIFGTNDSLPILGRYEYPLIHMKIFPFGSAAAIFYGIIVGHSVLQDHLLDIHVTLSEVAARVVRCLFLFIISLFLLLVATVVRPHAFTIFTFCSALVVLMLSAVIASIFFPRIFGGGGDKTERRILGDRFEYHDQVQAFIQNVRTYPEPEFLFEELDDVLNNTMRVRGCHIILLDDATRSFMLYHAYPPQPRVNLPEMQINSPVFRYFQQKHGHFLCCNPAYVPPRESPVEKAAREQLRPFATEFCFPFYSGEDLVGMLLLGPKVNKDLFTPHDLRLLGQLASNLGLMLNQVRLRNQLQVAHEQDLLGRMSGGLAHDLNNLLTPVQTLLQLFSEGVMDQEGMDQLLPVALRNLETVRTYVNEALFFSRTSALNGRAAGLEETVRDAVALVTTSAEKKGVEFLFNPEVEAVVEMDAVLIKRLLCNLLSNAVDASPAGSYVTVRLTTLPKTELGRDWFRLQVIDQGEGISAENLRRVFTPYFTTKNTGDGKRGFGLGLAIARKIVHLHGGNLSIASREKKGTTVQVDLPSKLNSSQNPANASAQLSARRETSEVAA